MFSIIIFLTKSLKFVNIFCLVYDLVCNKYIEILFKQKIIHTNVTYSKTIKRKTREYYMLSVL